MDGPLKPKPGARSSKVKVTKADGTEEIRSSYNKYELARVRAGKQPHARAKRPKTEIVQWKKNKIGKWVVYGPTTRVQVGKRLKVKGDPWLPNMALIERCGKPFMKHRVEMVYGYPLEQPVDYRQGSA